MEILRISGGFWTVANVLSLVRMLLAVPIAWLILADGSDRWVLGLLLFAMATDWLDGRIARWSGTVSEWGKILDPLADKIAAALVVPAVVLRGLLPVWFLIALLVRDAFILFGGVILVRRTGRITMSAWIGKVAAAGVALTVLAALMEADEPLLRWCLWIATVLLAGSFAQYTARFFRLNKPN